MIFELAQSALHQQSLGARRLGRCGLGNHVFTHCHYTTARRLWRS